MAGVFLSPKLLLSAYRQGVFPMAHPEHGLAWYSPDPRGVLPLENFHVPHGLRRVLRKRPFEIRVNTAFEAVVDACASRSLTWIDQSIKSSYGLLHREGHAHSVEAWSENELCGGLYGVSIGGAFFGESMFHRKTDASKVALHWLVEHMRSRGFGLLDLQWVTPHLCTFGAREVAREHYLRLLSREVEKSCVFWP
jgi:leucyl/phenylalanyl-tRNA--protein transferase